MSNYIFDYFDRKLVDFVKIVEFAIIDGNRNFTIFFHGTRLFYANYMKYFCRISRLFLDYFPTILLVETNTDMTNARTHKALSLPPSYTYTLYTIQYTL